MGSKLTIKGIRWALRELEKGDLSVGLIANHLGVTPRWIRQLPMKYEGISLKDIRLRPPGRKPIPISTQQRIIVRKTKETYGSGAVTIEKILAEKAERMPHNRIHRILRQEGLANREPKKSNQRKWVRWEREFSNDMWHTDYVETDEGKQMILYEDDASRCIMGYGEFDNATTDNAILVFDDAAALWGTVPTELLTDHGTQFCVDENNEYRFRNHIGSLGVKHVLARVKHPQTNGKQEKLGGTIKGIMRWKKCSLVEAVKFYNEVRPHMSLERDGHLRTPLVAYYEKMRPEKKKGTAYVEGYAYAKNASVKAWLELKRELEKEGVELGPKRRLEREDFVVK